MDGAAERYHVNPDTGLPNRCDDGDTCTFGSEDFHYPSKHDAQVAWKARQLERGIIAYRNVMRAKERDEEEAALEKLTGKAKGFSKKLSWSVVRSVVVRNASKYLVNFLGIFMAYAVASGEWLTEDWIRRLLPTVAMVVLVALLAWFGVNAYKGSRHAARVVRKRRLGKAVSTSGAPRPRARARK
ncbi:MAG TPA: hypothetical protein VM093_04435 [Aeromicrobium sp.]|nr:hypothetical protein [Aeromicrobium sp.]